MENIDALRAEVATLTGIDRPMGSVLAKSLEMIVAVRKDGIAAPDLGYSIDALTSELAVSVKHDKNKNDLLRRVVYGIMGQLGGMVTDLVDQRGEEKMEPQEEAIVEEKQLEAVMPEPESIENGNIDAEFLPENIPQFDDDLQVLVVKNEPLDPFMQSIVNAINGAEDNEPLDQTLPEPPEQQLQHVQPMEPVQPELPNDVTVDNENLQPLQPLQQLQLPSPLTPASVKNNEAVGSASKTGRKRKSCSYKEISDNENEEEGEEEEDDEFTDKITLKRRKSQIPAKKEATDRNCSICSRTFARVYEHAMHMKTHTGENTFDCDQCEKNFTTRPNLIRHLRNVHGSKPFECSTCSERFDMLSKLKNHWKSSGHQVETNQ